MHDLSEPQTSQHRRGKHQRANRPGLAFHLMQLGRPGSTSTSTETCMLPFSRSSNPIQKCGIQVKVIEIALALVVLVAARLQVPVDLWHMLPALCDVLTTFSPVSIAGVPCWPDVSATQS